MLPVFLLIILLPVIAALELRTEMFAMLLVLGCVVLGLTSHADRRHGHRADDQASDGQERRDRYRPTSLAGQAQDL